MTDDEIEQERAALLAEIELGRPLTEEQKRRLKAVAAHDQAQPRTPFGQAVYEVLAETVALADRTFPLGLEMRVVGKTIEVRSVGELIATISRPAVLEREAQIKAERN